MKILSLFDGMSVAQQAIRGLGFDYDYYASEIDEYAISVTQSNFPNTIQLGSIIGLNGTGRDLGYGYDLLIGGSPCQDLSIAKKGRKGLDGERSGLFYEYVRIRDEVKPKYFVLENVASMSKESKDKISEVLGVQPVMINAGLVSAQNRKRLFWVGKLDEFGTYQQVEISQPYNRGIMLKDILENGEADRLKSYCIDANYAKGANWKQYIEKGRRQLIRVGSLNSGGQGDRVYPPNGKSVALSAMGGGRGAKTGLYIVNGAAIRRQVGKKRGVESRKDGKANALNTIECHKLVSLPELIVRKLTPTECLRLQSMPDDYFDKAIYKNKTISNTQRYKMCGNAFNKEVIKHILKQLELIND